MGGGRLAWSPWSGMVRCAPTREEALAGAYSCRSDTLLLTLGTCRRELTPQHCNTRVRVRVTPHNSRWVTGQGWGGGEHLARGDTEGEGAQ